MPDSNSKDPNRTFSYDQKQALLMLADYKCQECSTEINFRTCHADHVIPWSLGGKTEIQNGQALCATCNLRKGVNMIPKIKDKKGKLVSPREWQKTAFHLVSKFIQNKRPSALLNVCPGGGKTKLGVMVAKYMLAQQKIDRVIIVSPRSKIKEQWADDLSINGTITRTNLDRRKAISRGDNLPDTAIAVTYQLVDPIISDYLTGVCTKYRTLVIMDEIHWTGKLGDEGGNSWGKNLVHATKNATFCLALSGTPFREDHYRIPFLGYENGMGKADYDYSYKDALEDGVVTPIWFRERSGIIKIHEIDDNGDPVEDGETETFDFDDGIYRNANGEPDEQRMNKRLTLSLHENSKYWRDLMDQAIEKLDWIREHTQPNAGGIIFSVDQNHARVIASHIAKRTGVNPAVIMSSEDTDIDSFAQSNAPWVVSVKMISEGVDIERLRVAVMLTNVTTRKNFMQSVARCIRLDYENNGSDCWTQEAYVYMPKDPRFMQYAQEFADAIADLEQEEPGTGGGGGGDPKIYEIDMSESELGGMIFGDEYWSAEEIADQLEEVENRLDPSLIKKLGASLSPEVFHSLTVQIMRDQRMKGDDDV